MVPFLDKLIRVKYASDYMCWSFLIEMNGKNWIKGPFLVNKMDFLIVFWWFRPKQSQWVTLGYSRQRQQLWSRCQEEPFIRTHQEISENGMENAKQSGTGPCLCLIFPLVPVRPSLLSTSPIILAFSSQRPPGSSPAKPAQQVNFRNYESELSSEYWFLCPQQYFSSIFFLDIF